MIPGGRLVVAVLTLTLTAVSCGGSSGGNVDGAETAGTATLRVLAAASLTDAMQDLATGFEQQSAQSGLQVGVELNVAGTATLREQILAGAPGDVFAAANSTIMDELDDAGELSGTAQPLAMNSMALVTPPNNPGGVIGLADLADDQLLVGLCAPGVPCGDFAAEILYQAGVEASVDTFEDNVRSLMTRVMSDELDAAIVYSSDAVTAGEAVKTIAIDPEDNIDAISQVAALRLSQNPNLAQQFVDYVSSPEGQAVLTRHGFRPVS